MGEVEQRPLKLYFLPFLAAGHMIPLCDIARLFASRDQHVTIITTPSNAQILRKSNHHFHIHTVDFPSQKVGLSDGVETMTSVADLQSATMVYKAAMLLRQPVEHFLRQNPPDCIVADFMYTWVSDLATSLQIPRLAFNGFSLFTVSAMHSFKAHPELRSGWDTFVLPGLPHPITMRTMPPEGILGFMEPLLDKELKSQGLIVNNFEEMESEYVEHYERTTGHKAWHLGPASLVHRSNQQKAERGHVSVVNEHQCLTWLNSKDPNSVVYICFGSTCRFPDRQLYEIACGIEASAHHFIWVVPEKTAETTENKEWVPEGFEERTKGKGMIIKGWAPQVLILEHPAVGGFVTHCGWNSVVEGVGAGVPMITWPVHSEQFYNEKLISEVQGIGVEVGAEEWGLTGFGERKKVVSREQIEKAVRTLMDGGHEAEEIRRRARQLAQKAREAVGDGGSSHKNLTALIHFLKVTRDDKPRS